MARPAQFDRDTIIEKAMETFWQNGYCATSMANLVDSTQLKPGSLYAAFQSKQGLFMATLDYYGNRSVTRLRHQLEESASPLQGILGYFDQLAEKIENQTDKTSCFLVNTVLELASQDETIRFRLNTHFEQIESLFRAALHDAMQRKELDADTDCNALAAFLMNNIWGLRVLAGTQPSAGRAQQVVRIIKKNLR